MNLFRLDDDPPEAAKLHADHHVRKMPTEACQLLATAHIKPQVDGYDEMTPQQRLAADLLPYNHTHVNHPCAIWVRSGLDNYMWGLALAAALVDEFQFQSPSRYRRCRRLAVKARTGATAAGLDDAATGDAGGTTRRRRGGSIPALLCC
jgi:hypothetical protein